MKENYKTSGIFLRVKSLVIDNLLLITLMFLASDLLARFENNNTNIKIMIFVFIFILYEPLSLTIFGKTLGHFLNQIKVIKHSNGKKLNLFQSIIRYLFKYLLGWLSFITVSFNKDSKAIHDIVVNSIVVIDEY